MESCLLSLLRGRKLPQLGITRSSTGSMGSSTVAVVLAVPLQRRRQTLSRC